MHALTRDRPLTCLEPLLSAAACNPLQQECSGPHPTVDHVVNLDREPQLAGISNIGVKRLLDIETCLARAGLIDNHAEPARQTPACAGQRPPVPAARPGSTSRTRTGLSTG